MAQPQSQQQFPMPQRPYSPPQGANSPGAPQFGMPPNKRQRLSPNPPSQPGSPYVQSPYGMSPSASAPPSASASPHFSTVSLPPNVYNTPYSNGHTTPSQSAGFTPSQSQPNNQPPSYQSPLSQPQNFNPIGQAGSFNFSASSQNSGVMGPPSKPAEKPREDVDPMDVLGGTGIDLREEEQYTFQIYKSFNSQQSGSQSGTISSGHSFSQFPPGDDSSFYGAGPANATAEVISTKSQDEFHKKVADEAWHDAARNLAVSRQLELRNPFLEVVFLQTKMAKIARDNGLALKVDSSGSMGRMRLPEDFTQREVRVQTAMAPSASFTATSGDFLPSDTQLVDQLALLSIASKHRLRSLIGEAFKLCKGRQTGSHGIVPEDWVDVAADTNAAIAGVMTEGGSRSGWESVASPQSQKIKRSPSSASQLPPHVTDSSKAPTTQKAFTHEVAAALRKAANNERDFEEARLRKRQLRREGGDGTPRQGSVAPGTPGSVAPEPSEKAPTKREQKKKAEAKVSEAASHAAANNTTAQFLGGGGGIFGKKKKYSWMTGQPGSGASTPGRISTQGLPGTPSGPVGPAAPEKLTTDSARRIGEWKESSARGSGIQIRDLISVLGRGWPREESTAEGLFVSRSIRAQISASYVEPEH